ncbi:DUF1573 domain-containing protein [Pedobacter sp. ASV28]|jgi:Protein of unknown function (DUF1573)|uniref:DUF1573 domain-containing protein n=1 Tax=Pedobacter sp. ASV28 TaxID=2795123 RepID=UPI0018ED312E|nr:DUF1573 domain-containing protein [Pedobacter sp. ASV28]
MKKLFLLFTVVIGLGFAANAQTKPAEFKFEAETHDFGKIALDKPVSYTFNFTNEGDTPLIITKVEPTCGCTVGEYTQTPVKKGEKGFIKVTVKKSGSPLPFNTAVTVTSNARTATKVLYLKGETVADASK